MMRWWVRAGLITLRVIIGWSVWVMTCRARTTQVWRDQLLPPITLRPLHNTCHHVIASKGNKMKNKHLNPIFDKLSYPFWMNRKIFRFSHKHSGSPEHKIFTFTHAASHPLCSVMPLLSANIRPDPILSQYLPETLSQPRPRDMSRQVSRFVTSLSRGPAPCQSWWRPLVIRGEWSHNVSIIMLW